MGVEVVCLVGFGECSRSAELWLIVCARGRQSEAGREEASDVDELASTQSSASIAKVVRTATRKHDVWTLTSFIGSVRVLACGALPQTQLLLLSLAHWR